MRTERMTTLGGQRVASHLERDYRRTRAVEFTEAREEWLMPISG
jgi:hypothetical protein